MKSAVSHRRSTASSSKRKKRGRPEDAWEVPLTDAGIAVRTGSDVATVQAELDGRPVASPFTGAEIRRLDRQREAGRGTSPH